MRKTTKVLMTILMIFAFAFVILHTVGVGIQTWNIASGEWTPAVDWSQFAALKITIVSLRLVTILVLCVMLLFFVRNMRRGGALFVRRNVRLIYWSLLPFVLYSLCDANFGVISGERQLVITTESMLGCLALLLVAVIYRQGVLLNEDNQLTI